MPKTVQQEVDENFEEFQKLLPSIHTQYQGKYALMKDKKVLGFYSSPEDARLAGELAIADKLFSIQHVTAASINLGFYNDAVLVAGV